MHSLSLPVQCHVHSSLTRRASFFANGGSSRNPKHVSHLFSPAAASFSIKCSSVSTAPVGAESASKFIEASKNGNLIPLCRCIFSDRLNPIIAYRCLVKEDDREAPSFLFESVEQGERGSNVGRYSVVGAQPTLEIVAKENVVTVMDHGEGSRTEKFVDDPMAIPRRMMEGWNPQIIDELPNAFCVTGFLKDSSRLLDKARMWLA